WRVSPSHIRMATVSGTNAYRDRPGRCPRHSRPALRGRAAGVRMSVGCGRSVAVSQGPRLPPVAQPGRRAVAFATAAVTQEQRRTSRLDVPGKGNYCLLTLRAL